MVHFRRYVDHVNTDSRDYWMLSIPESGADAKRFLDSKHIAYKKSASIDHLYKSHGRVQRGLPVYDKYTVQELQTCCLQRYHKLPASLPAGKLAMHAALVRYLEEKDEKYNGVCSRFEELPAELLDEILEYHFQYLEDRASNCYTILSQPPITRVSSELRRQSLPMFYKQCTSTIWARHSSFLQPVSIQSPFAVRCLNHAPDGFLGALQKLCFCVEQYIARDIRMCWRVELSAQSDLQIEWRLGDPYTGSQAAAYDDKARELQRSVREFFTARKDENGVFRLQRGDDVALIAMLG